MRRRCDQERRIVVLSSNPSRSEPAGRAVDARNRRTLVEVLQARAVGEGDKVVLNFLDDGQEVGRSLDYRALDGRARALAAILGRHAEPAGRPGDDSAARRPGFPGGFFDVSMRP